MSLSASGLLLLADLSTIARRTVITGTSTWFDAFVLAPGLHQQQRCDAFSSSISKRTGASASEPCTIKSTATGLETKVANEAVLGYLDRMAEGLNKAKTKGGEGISRGVTLHVGEQTSSNTPQTVAKSLGWLALRRLYNRLKERGIGNTVRSCATTYGFKHVSHARNARLVGRWHPLRSHARSSPQYLGHSCSHQENSEARSARLSLRHCLQPKRTSRHETS